jgi:transposase
MLREDLAAPRKQRHTARRIHARLVDEHDLTDITYSTVRDYVRTRRPQIWAEAGRGVEQAFVPQIHEPGAEAEVDFADLWVVLAGVKTKVFLFTLRLSYSGKAVHRAFATQSQEAFLEGHVAALEALGGVPAVHIRYDNLKAAVSRVLFGRTRVENARWVTFRSHYGFDAFYCTPGLDGAHEKGGVEGEGGRFRRTHLVPMPQVASLDELNERLAAHDTADDARRIASRAQPVGQDFALEAPLLRPLPAERFETGVTLSARVDRHARITVRQCQYSVPARLIGQRVRVLLRATGLLVFDGRRQVAVRERATVRGTQTLVLDHYLEVLARKPGALPGATALAQARAAGSFSAAHEAWWAAARAAHGDAGGTRALVEVLLLHRHLPATAVTAGLQAALAIGATSPDVVAVEARRASPGQDTGTGPSGTGPSGTGPSGTGPVLTLPVPPNPTVLTPDQRPLPTVTGYDQLLSRRTPSRVDPTPPVTAGEAIS